jgi:hypothetical protein
MAVTKLLGLLGWRQADAAEATRAPAPTEKKQAPRNRYQSVSVMCAGKHCAAVKSLAGQRFLTAGAPALPLPACSMAAQCKCRFQKHVDRRDYARRLLGEMSRWYGGAEKRLSRGGRRRSD